MSNIIKTDFTEKMPKTPVERLEKLVANNALTCDEVIDFIDNENYILINRIATENSDEFFMEYAEFIDFYFDVFGPNEDFMNYVDECYGDKIPFLFEFADDCCRKRELACMSETQKDNANALKCYVMSINAQKSFVARLDNGIMMGIDIPKNIPAKEAETYNNEVEDICMHLACFGGQAYLTVTYTDSQDKKISVINGFMSLDGIMANLSANNMQSMNPPIVNAEGAKTINKNGRVRFETASCVFKKPQFNKSKANDGKGEIIHFPTSRLKN